MSSQESRAGVHVSVAARTDRGRVRSKNEDAFLIADLTTGKRAAGGRGTERVDMGAQGVLLVVSDGIGGQEAGEVASALVVEGIARALAEATPSGSPAEQLKEAATRAHQDVAAAAHGRGREGMGATLTAVYLTGSAAYVAEVGDSRAYLLRAGRLSLLTRDQSVAQVLMDAGALEPEAAKDSPMKNVLAQAMGYSSKLQVAIGKLSLRDRDCLLLCSDGLTGAVNDDEIRRTILGSKNLDDACQRLVGFANQRGGRDNTTVIVAGVGGELPRARENEVLGATYEVLERYVPAGLVGNGVRPIVPASVKVTR